MAVRGDFVLRRLRAPESRAGLGDIVIHGLLLRGEAFHGFDEVRNQVGAPLEDDVNLRPIGFDRFIEHDHLVAVRNVHAAEKQRENHEHHDDSEENLHEQPPGRIYHK